MTDKQIEGLGRGIVLVAAETKLQLMSGEITQPQEAATFALGQIIKFLIHFLDKEFGEEAAKKFAEQVDADLSILVDIIKSCQEEGGN